MVGVPLLKEKLISHAALSPTEIPSFSFPKMVHHLKFIVLEEFDGLIIELYSWYVVFILSARLFIIISLFYFKEFISSDSFDHLAA